MHEITSSERKELDALRQFYFNVCGATLDPNLGQGVSGADFVDSISDIVERHFGEHGGDVYIALGAATGGEDSPRYWSADEGWTGEPDGATVKADPGAFNGLAGVEIVVAVPGVQASEIGGLPYLGDLRTTALAVLNETQASEANAAELMLEATAPVFAPEALGEFLGKYLLQVKAEVQQSNREGAPRP